MFVICLHVILSAFGASVLSRPFLLLFVLLRKTVKETSADCAQDQEMYCGHTTQFSGQFVFFFLNFRPDVRPGVQPDVRPGFRPDVRADVWAAPVLSEGKENAGGPGGGSPPAKPVKAGVGGGFVPPAKIRGVWGTAPPRQN